MPALFLSYLPQRFNLFLTHNTCNVYQKVIYYSYLPACRSLGTPRGITCPLTAWKVARVLKDWRPPCPPTSLPKPSRLGLPLLLLLVLLGLHPMAHAQTPVSVTFSGGLASNGFPVTGTVTLSAAAPALGTAITLTSDDTRAVVPPTLTIAAGAISGTFTVPAFSASSNGATTFNSALITATGNGVSQTASLGISTFGGVGTPVPGTPAALSSFAVTPTNVTSGTACMGTVTLTKAASSGTTVSITSSNPAVTVPASVPVAAGAATATFTVSISAVPAVEAIGVKAAYGNASQSVILTVNPAPTIPAYLSNLTVGPTAITGGGMLTGTVTLSNPAPTGGIVIALHSSNSAAMVPATRTISAGATQATFNITTTAVSAAVSATISGSYNGYTQGDVLSVLPSTPPVVPSPGVPVIHVAPGNGCAIVFWNQLADGTVSGYNVYRVSGGTKTLLTLTPFKSNFYPVMGLTNDTATYTYQVAAVDTQGKEQALSTSVSVVPSSATPTMNWITQPSAVTNDLMMNVSLSSRGQIYGAGFFIDGVQLGGAGGETLYVNGVRTHIAGAGYDSTELSNGPHTVQLLGFADANQTIAAVTPLTPIQVSNTISNSHLYGAWFDPTQGEICYLSATVPAGSTWTVQVIPQDGTTVLRTWQGASSLVKLAWDGKDAAGTIVPLTDYALQLTVQPSGTSSNTMGAQATPNAAGAVKKTHPVKVLQGQPVALALISVGASYYEDSNKVVIPTPAQDILLSNVLTNAYTTLYGAKNFQIIISDTFTPYQEIKPGVTELTQLERLLGTAQVFYLFGHGAGAQGKIEETYVPRSTVFDGVSTSHRNRIVLYSTTVPFVPGPFDIIVPTYVKSHNYVFAWNDACNSAGGDSDVGTIGTVDYAWATAFNVTTFIGNNGFGIVNNGSTTSSLGNSGWYKWRNTFWSNLSKGQFITQAYLNCWVVDGVGPGGTHFSYGQVSSCPELS